MGSSRESQRSFQETWSWKTSPCRMTWEGYERKFLWGTTFYIQSTSLRRVNVIAVSAPFSYIMQIFEKEARWIETVEQGAVMLLDRRGAGSWLRCSPISNLTEAGLRYSNRCLTRCHACPDRGLWRFRRVQLSSSRGLWIHCLATLWCLDRRARACRLPGASGRRCQACVSGPVGK